MKVTINTASDKKAKPTFTGEQIMTRPGVYVRPNSAEDYFIVILNDPEYTRLFINPKVPYPIQIALSHHFIANRSYVEADETVSLTFQN